MRLPIGSIHLGQRLQIHACWPVVGGGRQLALAEDRPGGKRAFIVPMPAPQVLSGTRARNPRVVAATGAEEVPRLAPPHEKLLAPTLVAETIKKDSEIRPLLKPYPDLGDRRVPWSFAGMPRLVNRSLRS